mmetsp:Transcript_3172/g.3857  ORF Transcript_3172/g.3857 Transcript_3172/m.3857 type:complete len:93 (-) Transcript_3172:166-444(-)
MIESSPDFVKSPPWISKSHLGIGMFLCFPCVSLMHTILVDFVPSWGLEESAMGGSRNCWDFLSFDQHLSGSLRGSIGCFGGVENMMDNYCLE